MGKNAQRRRRVKLAAQAARKRGRVGRSEILSQRYQEARLDKPLANREQRRGNRTGRPR